MRGGSQLLIKVGGPNEADSEEHAIIRRLLGRLDREWKGIKNYTMIIYTI